MNMGSLGLVSGRTQLHQKWLRSEWQRIRRISVISFLLISSPNNPICENQQKALPLVKRLWFCRRCRDNFFFFSHSPLPRCRKHLAVQHYFTALFSVVCFITSIRALLIMRMHTRYPRRLWDCVRGPSGWRPALANNHRSWILMGCQSRLDGGIVTQPCSCERPTERQAPFNSPVISLMLGLPAC